jgi:hypothetical protein
MKVETHDRQSEVEAVPLEAKAVADLESQDPQRFTGHGTIPEVSEESAFPVQPSASERAFGGGHAATSTKGAAPADRTVLTTTVRRVIDGITVVAPPGAHADAIDRCAEFIQQELGRNEYAQHAMAEARTTIIIIPAHSKMTDLPEFSSLGGGKKTFDGRDWSTVRGSGGVKAPDGSFAIGVAEENLRSVQGVVSKYAKGYSIGMHELAHALESKGLTDEQKARLQDLYKRQKQADPSNANDTFTDEYSAKNVHEYFAQSTNAFFGKNAGKVEKGDANHNGRAWLYAKDPDMYAFLVELYDMNHDIDGNRAP